MLIFNDHHRNYAYRPPLKREVKTNDGWSMFKDFFGKYLYQFRWKFAICSVLLIITACAGYLITYMQSVVVDHILVVQSTEETSVSLASPSLKAGDRRETISPRPKSGLGRRMDMGISFTQRPAEAGRLLFLLAVIYFGFQILVNYLSRICFRMRVNISEAVVEHLREDMHTKVLELSMAYHHSMSPGRLLSRMISDIGAVQNEAMAFFVNASVYGSVFVIGLIILFTNEWRIGMIALVVVPIYGLLFKLQRPLLRRHYREASHTTSCIYGLATQKIDAMKAIQSYAREPGEARSFHALCACYFRDAVAGSLLDVLLGFQGNVLAAVSTAVVLIYGGHMVLNGELGIGMLIYLYMTACALFQPAAVLADLGNVTMRLRISLMRVYSVLNQKAEITEAVNAVDFPRPIQMGVEVRNLNFSYPANRYSREPGEEDNTSVMAQAEPVLKNISFSVPAGTWLCIMGASGSGKTTLLHLLSRIYEPTSGEILIDGVPLKNITMYSLRHAMGVVPQEAQIFSGTMRDNICYGLPDATNKQIMDAAKAAQMHDFIMEMKVKYETIIGEKGTSLSGGQRQRLSLARALLTSPELLILDDCTSALDANTERKIQDTLQNVLKGKTAIMVSQRVSMAMRCHKICVLENGEITEFGTHHELLENHGFYSRLYAQQTE